MPFGPSVVFTRSAMAEAPTKGHAGVLALLTVASSEMTACSDMLGLFKSS